MSMGGNRSVVNSRMQGVQPASNHVIERGEPKKLRGLMRADVLFAEYTDAKGEVRQGMYFLLGDQLLGTVDTEEWCRTKVKPVSKWLAEQILTRYSAREDQETSEPPDVPEEDAVDIFGGEGA